MKALVARFESNKQPLQVKLHADKMFIAKVLHAVDDRICHWLKECMKAENVIDTNLGLTKMSNIFEHIQMGIFHQFLPPSVVKVLED